MADGAGFLTIHVVKERIVGMNYHPAFNWYGLLIFAAVVIGLVTWARRRVLAENDSGETVVNDSQWSIFVTTCQPAVYDSQNGLMTAFVEAFEGVMGMPVDLLPSVESAIGSLPYQQVPRYFLFQEPLTAINGDTSGESLGCIDRGHTLMLTLYPMREEDERTPRYSEIEESGVLDRPRKLLFSVHYASTPCSHHYGGCYQAVVLVPAVESEDYLQGTTPVLLLAEIASPKEGNPTAEWDA